jgi:hypothetical protein
MILIFNFLGIQPLRRFNLQNNPSQRDLDKKRWLPLSVFCVASGEWHVLVSSWSVCLLVFSISLQSFWGGGQ